MIADSVNPLIIFTFLTNPFQWILEQLTSVFKDISVLATIGSFGLAVIVLTLAIRSVLFPIFAWQLRTSRRIQSEQRMIAPQLQELRKKYKGQPQKLSAEMNKLYREHGISPFSGLTGCLPLIVQMPVLIGLYNAIRQATGHVAGHTSFLWIHNLSQSAHDACCSNNNWLQVFSQPGLLILPVLAAGLTFAQSRMMMPPIRPDMSDQERSMAKVTKQMSLFFPVIILLFSLNFPQGLALYWVTGTLFMVVQQYLVVGWGGLRVPAWVPGASRTTSLSYPKAALTSTKPVKKDPKQPDATPQDGQVSANGSQNPASANGPSSASGGKQPARTGSMAANRAQSRQARARKRRRR